MIVTESEFFWTRHHALADNTTKLTSIKYERFFVGKTSWHRTSWWEPNSKHISARVWRTAYNLHQAILVSQYASNSAAIIYFADMEPISIWMIVTCHNTHNARILVALTKIDNVFNSTELAIDFRQEFIER
jgi:hypothetical protein